MDDDKESLDAQELPRISTGNAGLDDILGGGIDPERMYLIERQPRPGKTTLALEFLLEGVRRRTNSLHYAVGNRARTAQVAKRHGWSLKGITIFELVPPSLDPSQELTVSSC
jgi:circadian clock protein KaiC